MSSNGKWVFKVLLVISIYFIYLLIYHLFHLLVHFFYLFIFGAITFPASKQSSKWRASQPPPKTKKLSSQKLNPHFLQQQQHNLSICNDLHHFSCSIVLRVHTSITMIICLVCTIYDYKYNPVK